MDEKASESWQESDGRRIRRGFVDWVQSQGDRLVRSPKAMLWSVLAVVALSMGLTLVDGPFPVSKTGTLGHWVSGVGSLGAVVIAIAAFQRENDRRLEDFERSVRSAQERTERDHLAEARAIVALPRGMSDDAADMRRNSSSDAIPDGLEAREWKVVVKNESLRPIYHIELTVDWGRPVLARDLDQGTYWDTDAEGQSVPLEECLETISRHPWDGPIHQIPPGGHRDLRVVGLLPESVDNSQMTITFWDVHGNRWLKQGYEARLIRPGLRP